MTMAGERYAWINDHDVHQGYCFTFVRGLTETEVLRRFGADPETARPLTLEEAARHDSRPMPVYVLVVRIDDWVVAVEDMGYQGSRPEVLSAVSAGTEVVSVYQGFKGESALNHAVDGQLRTSFEPLFPEQRFGTEPDALVPLMVEVGLDPDGDDQWRDELPPVSELALELADRITGVHLPRQALDGALTGAMIMPLLPPANEGYRRFNAILAGDREFAAAIEAATPQALRAAVGGYLRWRAGQCGLDDPLLLDALAAGERGEPWEFDSSSPLGWAIRRLERDNRPGYDVGLCIRTLLGAPPQTAALTVLEPLARGKGDSARRANALAQLRGGPSAR